MNILVLTSRLPYPPDRGDRLRVYNFLRSLAGLHKLTLISFIAKEDERQNLKFLEPYCENILLIEQSRLRSILTIGLNFWRNLPLQILYYRSSAMQQLVSQTLAESKFDLIYAHLARMAPYALNASDVYRVVDLTDLISKEIQLSLKYRKLASKIVFQLEQKRMEKYEKEVMNRFDEVWLISDSEWKSASGICHTAKLQVVKNGVDTSTFYPLDIGRKSNQLIFVGHLSVFHNIDAARYLVEKILPQIREEIPGIELVIIGRDPAPGVSSLEANPGVHVAGYVEDLNRSLNMAALFAAPLRFAAGVQNKVLEAMAAGIPVVTTPLVVEGIGAIPGHDLIMAETDSNFAKAIIELLKDPGRASQIGAAGCNFVRRNYSWGIVLEHINTIEDRLDLYKTGPGERSS